jgi:hypothetical protein
VAADAIISGPPSRLLGVISSTAAESHRLDPVSVRGAGVLMFGNGTRKGAGGRTTRPFSQRSRVHASMKSVTDPYRWLHPDHRWRHRHPRQTMSHRSNPAAACLLSRSRGSLGTPIAALETSARGPRPVAGDSPGTADSWLLGMESSTLRSIGDVGPSPREVGVCRCRGCALPQNAPSIAAWTLPPVDDS